jgi:hypothetical protein
MKECTAVIIIAIRNVMSSSIHLEIPRLQFQIRAKFESTSLEKGVSLKIVHSLVSEKGELITI